MSDDVSASESARTVRVRKTLSPSRAEDFVSCPLKYRYRTIDRLPEPPSATATRGTLVHAVLERLFDNEPAQRTLAAAQDMLPGEWRALLDSDSSLASLFADGAEERLWLESAKSLLDSYFAMEDPQRLEPAKREWRAEWPLDSGLTFVGVLDRMEVAPDGRVRIVDYKTGKAPAERFQDRAMNQMRFYAYLVWQVTGVVPTLLQLLYLGDRKTLNYEPTEPELLNTKARFEAIWEAIENSLVSGVFEHKPGPLCRFCSFQDACPQYGAEVLPIPTIQFV